MKTDEMQMEQMIAGILEKVLADYIPSLELLEYPSITLKQAEYIIKKVEEKASEMGVKAVIAVTNSGAHPVAVHCMDHSLFASYEIALQKAYTVVSLKMSTSTLKGLCQPGGPLYGIQHTSQGKIIIFGGGEPFVHQGMVLGGLGVSGGTEEQDSELAEYGKMIAKEAFQWQ